MFIMRDPLRALEESCVICKSQTSGWRKVVGCVTLGVYRPYTYGCVCIGIYLYIYIYIYIYIYVHNYV